MCARARGIFQGEKDPFSLQATPTGASPAKGARPRCLYTCAPNPLVLSPLCPCAALTGGKNLEAEPLLATHLPALGFFPFSLFATAREGEQGEWGEGRKSGEGRPRP
jgi:hypothetical protein